jgi:cytosine deaminase
MAWSMVTDAARTALGRAPVAIAPGSAAELVAVPASSLRQAIAFGPADRKVWHRGRRVA